MAVYHEKVEGLPEKLKDEQIKAKIKAFMPDADFTGYNWTHKRDFEERFFSTEFELWLIRVEQPFKLSDFLSYMSDEYSTVVLLDVREAADGATIKMELREFAPGRYLRQVKTKEGYYRMVRFEEDGTPVDGEIDEAGFYSEVGEEDL